MWLLFNSLCMQFKTLHQGRKCSWHDCSQLMSFPPNRNWFNLHDIYLFIQSLPTVGPNIPTPHIGLILRSLFHSLISSECHVSFRFVGILASRQVFSGLLVFQTKPASILAGAQALCMRPNCPVLRPNVYHSVVLLLARSPSFIDFPLLCHCGGLFKHTFPDVWPHTHSIVSNNQSW